MVDRPDLPVVIDAQKVVRTITESRPLCRGEIEREKEREIKRGKKGREKPRNGEKVSSSRAANDRRKHRCRFLFSPYQKPVLPPVETMKTSPSSISRCLTTNLLFPLLPLLSLCLWRAIRSAIKRGKDKGKIKRGGEKKVENSVEHGPSSVVSKSMRKRGEREKTENGRKKGTTRKKEGKGRENRGERSLLERREGEKYGWEERKQEQGREEE